MLALGHYEQLILLSHVIAYMKSYRDVFAWYYGDLEGIPLEIEVHTIPLVDGV